MAEEKMRVGDIRPVFQQTGFEVCKVISGKEEDQVWIATDRAVEAELLSAAFKNQKSEKE